MKKEKLSFKDILKKSNGKNVVLNEKESWRATEGSAAILFYLSW